MAPPPGLLGATVGDRLEAAFLAEMLSIAMPDSPGEFGGGIGETQFTSFLHEQHAAALATRLDLGLARHLDGRNA